jgi:hypothetical protein
LEQRRVETFNMTNNELAILNDVRVIILQKAQLFALRRVEIACFTQQIK